MHFQNPNKERQASRERRRARVRAKVHGTAARPRLVVTRTLAHITAQIIDDALGRTLVAVSDLALPKEKKSSEDARTAKVARAHRVGLLIAERAKAKGIQTVVFDRAGRAYHGRVAALAEGAREGGLIF